MNAAATSASASVTSTNARAARGRRRLDGCADRRSTSTIAQVSSPPISSTSGYRGEMRAPQQRARPRKTSQETIGTLSYQAIGFPQMQCEPGETMLSSRGTRTMTTLRKLPTKRPKRIAVARISHGGTSATSICLDSSRVEREAVCLCYSHRHLARLRSVGRERERNVGTMPGEMSNLSAAPPRAAAFRRAKIVCTIGPASSSPEMLDALVAAGMDVARLNFAHGTHDEHRARLQAVRAAAERFGKPLAVLQDLCGPKIRAGAIPG